MVSAVLTGILGLGACLSQPSLLGFIVVAISVTFSQCKAALHHRDWGVKTSRTTESQAHTSGGALNGATASEMTQNQLRRIRPSL
jgi:hypothetical protein